MLKILIIIFSLFYTPIAGAAISCPANMALFRSSTNQTSDCLCISGQRPRMTILSVPSPATTTGNPTPIFGTCPNAKVFIPTTLSDATLYSGTSQTFTVPQDGIYTIEAWGAGGGSARTIAGGSGAWVRGSFSLTAGTLLTILVGQHGGNDPFLSAAGGGGATYLWQSSTPLIIAAGGGGAGSAAGQNGTTTTTSCSTACTYSTLTSSTSCNGTPKTNCTTTSGSGGDGGYGNAGGGNCTASTGGAGGGCSNLSSSTGTTANTSYIASTAITPSSIAGIQKGDGQVIISW